jgi:hypothetical protein
MYFLGELLPLRGARLGSTLLDLAYGQYGAFLRVSKGHLGVQILLFRAGLGVSPLVVSILTICQVNLHNHRGGLYKWLLPITLSS